MRRDLNKGSDTEPILCNITGGYMPGAAFTESCTYSIPAYPNIVSPNVGHHISKPEFEPYTSCPQNLIIFDQTDMKHRIMYNPVFVQKVNFQNHELKLPHLEFKDLSRLYNSPSFKEDTDEIDILLSSDEEEGFEDDDTVSTGRTPGNSCSTSSNSSSCDSFPERPDLNNFRREKIQKIVRILQEIVPGMEGSDTGTILDEAVKYLKYLKMEVEKLGISSFNCELP